MKKTVNVNIGNRAFILDEDAYNKLHNYLDEIGLRLNGDEKQEVLEDIESRIADLLQECLSSRVQVVDLEQVKRVMAIIGNVREFGEPHHRPNPQPQPTPPISAKRFYRSRTNRVIGGVCGGLAAYYQWDTLTIRILSIVFAIFTIIPFVVYIVLWIIMPAEELPQAGSYHTPIS